MLCKLYKGHLQVNAIQIIDQKKKRKGQRQKGQVNGEKNTFRK